jgi:hypothetical protein
VTVVTHAPISVEAGDRANGPENDAVDEHFGLLAPVLAVFDAERVGEFVK